MDKKITKRKDYKYHERVRVFVVDFSFVRYRYTCGFCN